MGGTLKVLLDTHVLIWWWRGDVRLDERIATLIATGGDDIHVSAVSAWEIATKRRIGKLPELDGGGFDFRQFVATQRLATLPVTVEHALRGGGYDTAHADPFDRLLAAQSELEDMPLVTRDPAFAVFPCETRW